MHRKPELDLPTLYHELERTLRNLRKVKRAGEETMADERINQTIVQETAAERLQRRDTMEYFGDLSSKKNTQQLDNLLWKPTTSS